MIPHYLPMLPAALPQSQTPKNPAFLLAMIASVIIHLWIIYAVTRYILIPNLADPANRPLQQSIVTIRLNASEQLQNSSAAQALEQPALHQPLPIDTTGQAIDPPTQPASGSDSPASQTAPKSTTPAINPETLRKKSNALTPLKRKNFSAPPTGGMVFDPKLQQQMDNARRNKQRDKREQPRTYIGNSGHEVYVNGDTCHTIVAPIDDHGNEQWNIGTRCKWVKTESENFMDRVNAAMKARFQQGSL